MLLLERVRQFVRRHALFGDDTRVMVAVSGGSDSVALAALMGEFASTGGVRLAGLAHFNHQLRANADRDEEFSRSLASSLGVPFASGREDVRARQRRERRSLEDAAREARYGFFEQARRTCDADVVALGHTRDDQAETVLLRLLRGAGARGFAAMYPRRDTIVRPVLDCRRMELRAYLEARGIPYLDDETNGDVGIPRNRVRAELVPLLIERFNPAIVDVLAREASLNREIWAWLESEAAQFETHVRIPGPEGASPLPLELDVERLRQAAPPLRRLALWRAMTIVADGRPVGFDHVDAALELLEPYGHAVDGPGQRLERVGGRIVLTGRASGTVGRRQIRPVNLFEYPLSIPGEVLLPETGSLVSAEIVADEERFAGLGADRAGTTGGGGPSVLVRRDCCGGTLAVRNRRPGDRFRPVGVGGQKKLQDYFVDRKVARAERGRVPLVVNEAGRIVWVAGYGIDEAFRVTDASQSMLLLRLKLWGGCA